MRRTREVDTVSRTLLMRVMIALMAILLLSLAIAGSVFAAPAPVRSSTGTVYVLHAIDVTLTTRQVGAYQRAGTLAQEIADRAHLLVRVLPDREIYGGVVESADLSTMRDASQIKEAQTYHVTYTVNETRPSEGEIVIAVTVTPTAPIMVDSGSPGGLIHNPFKPPKPDSGGGGGHEDTASPDMPISGLPTEIAAITPAAGADTAASAHAGRDNASAKTDATGEANDDAANKTATSPTAAPRAVKASLLDRFLKAVQSNGPQGWMALGIECVAVFGIAPAFISSIAGDVHVLKWHDRKKAQMLKECGRVHA